MNYIEGLEFLQDGHVGKLQLKNGDIIPYGVLKKTATKLFFYTGTGLNEIFKTDMTEEEMKRASELKLILVSENGVDKLINSGHVDVVNLTDVSSILS